MHILILVIAIYLIIGLLIATILNRVCRMSISSKDTQYVMDKMADSVKTPEDDKQVSGDMAEIGTMYDPCTSVGYLSICVMWPRVLYIYGRLIKRIFDQGGMNQWPE